MEPVSCGPCMLAMGAGGEADPLSGLDAESWAAIEAALVLEGELLARGSSPDAARSEAVRSLGCDQGSEDECSAFYSVYRAARLRALLYGRALDSADMAEDQASRAELSIVGGDRDRTEAVQYELTRAFVAQIMTSCPAGANGDECVTLFGGMAEVLRALYLTLAQMQEPEIEALMPLPVYFGPMPEDEPELEAPPAPSPSTPGQSAPDPATPTEQEDRRPPFELRLDAIKHLIATRAGSRQPATTNQGGAEGDSAPHDDMTAGPRGRIGGGEHTGGSVQPADSGRGAMWRHGMAAIGKGNPAKGLKYPRGAVSLVMKRPGRHESRVAYTLGRTSTPYALALWQWQELEGAYQAWRRDIYRRSKEPRGGALSPDLMGADDAAELARKVSARIGARLKTDSVEAYAMGRGRWEHFLDALWVSYNAQRQTDEPAERERSIAIGQKPRLDLRSGFDTYAGKWCRSARRDVSRSESNEGPGGDIFAAGCRYPSRHEGRVYFQFRRYALGRLPKGIASIDGLEAAVFAMFSGRNGFEAPKSYQIIPPPPRTATSIMAPANMDAIGTFDDAKGALVSGYGMATDGIEGAAGAIGGFFGGIGKKLKGVWGGDLNNFGEDMEAVDAEILDDGYGMVRGLLPAASDDFHGDYDADVDELYESMFPAIAPLGADGEGLGATETAAILAAVVAIAMIAGGAYVIPQVMPHFFDLQKSFVAEAGPTLRAVLPNMGKG